MLPLLVFWAIGSVQAAEPIRDSNVQPVAFTTGQNGSKLKWLPARPAQSDGVVRATVDGSASPVQSAQFTEPGSPRLIVEAEGEAQPSVAPPKLNDSVLQQPTVTAQQPPILSKPEPKAESLVPILAQPNAKESSAKPPAFGLEGDAMAVAPIRKNECDDVTPPKPLNPDILELVMPEPGVFPQSCPMGPNVAFQPRYWQPVTFHWTASALCYKPAYFEEVQVARYGHTWGPVAQPFVSAGHFFLTVPALPYAMALYPPNECVYALGFYRPGSCTPYYLDPLPLSVRATLVEGGALAGLILLIP